MGKILFISNFGQSETSSSFFLDTPENLKLVPPWKSMIKKSNNPLNYDFLIGEQSILVPALNMVYTDLTLFSYVMF